ncbi:uncharacterized protein LOC131879073 [Tigriopus californicus]|uniref:uncharacterized protein LOC131879073 n=1 Tax=Tigriopus californicus TaxID=6832 RepID=UPI0027D9ED21|nr:uncharacterized protein LOC131879073 [Tigriopus californicus]
MIATFSKEHSVYENILADYEAQVGEINSVGQKALLKRKWSFVIRIVLDLILCQAILGPLVILFWRGTWDYTILVLDKVYQDDCITPNLICLMGGFTMSFILQYFQHHIKYLAGHSKCIRFKLVARLYSVLIGISDIMYWKGIWDGIDCLSGTSPLVAVGTMVAGTLILTLFKTLKSTISAPLGIVLDTSSNCCQTATYFNNGESESLLLNIGDITLTLILEGFVVLFWHGIWTLIDSGSKYYAVGYTFSAWMSLLFGFIGAVLLCFVQFPIMNVHLSEGQGCAIKSTKWFLNFSFAFTGGVVTINSFRGVWYLADIYYLPDQYSLSLNHGWIISTLAIFVLSIGCSLHPGLVRDAPDRRDGLLIPVYYSAHFFIQELGMKDRFPVSPS